MPNTTTQAPEVGDICLLRGGHVLRYHGPYGGKGPGLVFRSPLDPVEGVPSGPTVAQKDILRVMGESDLPWLQSRRDQCAARKLNEEAIVMIAVIDELARKSV